MTRTLTRPLIELLHEAPPGAVPFVQDAIRAVAVGDWLAASRQMGLAAESSAEADDWFRVAGRCADELRAFNNPHPPA